MVICFDEELAKHFLFFEEKVFTLLPGTVTSDVIERLKTEWAGPVNLTLVVNGAPVNMVIALINALTEWATATDYDYLEPARDWQWRAVEIVEEEMIQICGDDF